MLTVTTRVAITENDGAEGWIGVAWRKLRRELRLPGWDECSIETIDNIWSRCEQGICVEPSQRKVHRLVVNIIFSTGNKSQMA
jgi:hypothetical protein